MPWALEPCKGPSSPLGWQASASLVARRICLICQRLIRARTWARSRQTGVQLGARTWGGHLVLRAAVLQTGGEGCSHGVNAEWEYALSCRIAAPSFQRSPALCDVALQLFSYLLSQFRQPDPGMHAAGQSKDCDDHLRRVMEKAPQIRNAPTGKRPRQCCISFGTLKLQDGRSLFLRLRQKLPRGVDQASLHAFFFAWQALCAAAPRWLRARCDYTLKGQSNIDSHCLLTGTLLFSGLHFNAGAWPQLSAAQRAHPQHVKGNEYRQ
eukprot:6033264-Pyramimonas_sp.AAC.1